MRGAFILLNNMLCVFSSFDCSNNHVLNVIMELAVILLATKLFGLVARKLGLPQVVGMVIAGIIVGPAVVSLFGWNFKGIINPGEGVEMYALNCFSQIGVIMILFSSGLETKVRELKKCGLAATVIAICGVVIPIAVGFIAAMLFMGWDFSNRNMVLNAIFVGAILSATSVGITVETLKELGKLSGKVGTTILSAAIIDDVIGIIALSIVISLKEGGDVIGTIIKAIAFFVIAVGVGLALRVLFKHLHKTSPHRRRIRIYALAMCFIYAYCAETFFDVAAITGAYMAGLMLSGTQETVDIDRKVVVSGYLLFLPVFFAYIGVSADFSGLNLGGVLFGLVFVAGGILSKIVGCGAAAKCFGYSTRESSTIGCGMIARGEVALAVYAAGSGLIWRGETGQVMGIDPLVGVIMLIIISSILCPILLKACFGKGEKAVAEEIEPSETDEANEEAYDALVAEQAELLAAKEAEEDARLEAAQAAAKHKGKH